MPLEQITLLVLTALAWAWLFVLAPGRAYRAGVALDNPPIQFQMQGFKIFKVVALLAMLGGAYVALTPPARLADPTALLTDAQNGVYTGGLVGAAIIGIFLFAWPHLTATKRIKDGGDPGEWLTITLAYYRWFVLGVVIFGTLILPEIFGDVVIGGALGLGFCLFYLLWWGIPAASVAKTAERGDPFANSCLGDVRRSGVFGWLGYLGKRRKRDSGTAVEDERKYCPTCMRTIDEIARYSNMEFDRCPHCHEMIPVVFTIADYIRDRSQRLLELNEMRRDGGKKKELRLAEEEGKDLMGIILRSIVTMGVRERGTDLHMARDANKFVVRCRTDGMLFTMISLNEELLKTLISAVKVQCKLDITEREKPQDGSFSQPVDGKTIDVRVNTSPSRTGETATMRLLNQGMVFGSLEGLGFTRRNLENFKQSIQKPHGMILVTGPTGSGKTTTLYNALAVLADGKRNIITLEDPIEFEIEGLNQMQINARKEFTFASGLRSILRQDPDVIMVGEIRDGETAKMATDAAMTGHLVFSTLHTIDTATTLGRLTDLEVDPARHSEALLLVVAQRLIRLNCSECLVSAGLTRAQLEAAGFPNGPERMTTKHGRGCEHCHETGFYGREGIYELMVGTPTLKRVISEGASPEKVRDQARRDGMRTLQEDGLTRVFLGRTTIEELKRVTS